MKRAKGRNVGLVQSKEVTDVQMSRVTLSRFKLKRSSKLVLFQVKIVRKAKRYRRQTEAQNNVELLQNYTHDARF